MVCISGTEEAAYALGGRGGRNKSFVAVEEVGRVLLHMSRKAGEEIEGDPVLGGGDGSRAEGPPPHDGRAIESSAGAGGGAPLAWIMDPLETVRVEKSAWALSAWALTKAKLG